jgi:hypothetical protein
MKYFALKMAVFWNFALCVLVGIVCFITMMMEAVIFSEVLKSISSSQFPVVLIILLFPMCQQLSEIPVM